MRRQRQNANRHTERGMAMLKQSVEQDGWIGAITVAANDETFDGSARLEVNQAEPIIIDSDGSRPIVVRRTDIGTADDPKAHRLGIAANRVAQANLDWDPAVLAELAGTVDLSGFWNDDELSALLAEPNVPEPGMQQELQLPSACRVEITCSQAALAVFQPTLDLWSARHDCTIDIS